MSSKDARNKTHRRPRIAGIEISRCAPKTTQSAPFDSHLPIIKLYFNTQLLQTRERALTVRTNGKIIRLRLSFRDRANKGDPMAYGFVSRQLELAPEELGRRNLYRLHCCTLMRPRTVRRSEHRRFRRDFKDITPILLELTAQAPSQHGQSQNRPLTFQKPGC